MLLRIDSVAGGSQNLNMFLRVLSVVATLQVGSTALASEWIVAGSGGDFTSIQAALAAGETLTLQLSNTEGSCWGTRYSIPALQNRADLFKDRND